MLVRVLGEVDVLAGGAPVRIGSRNQRVILATLAARRDVAVSSDLLIDTIWGDDPPPSAPGSLRTYVSRLRRLLGDHLAIGPAGYTLDLEGSDVDADRFDDLVSRARGVEPAAAMALLDEALALWRGPPFGDVADVEPVRGVAAGLRERQIAAREARAGCLLACGRPAEAVGAAEQLVNEHPLREGGWAVLVQALAATDRVSEALRAYQRAAGALAEAGLEPSDRLRRAERAALAGERPKVSPRQLAVPGSSLVGRGADVAAVAGLLSRGRIVTLVGPGGVGKTRLALAVAREITGRFEWGARQVALDGVNDPSAVAGVVADGLGLTVEPGAPERALAHAGQLDLLVVLDNCEHVADAAAAAAEALITGGSSVRVLATSREPLAIDGEHRYPVTPLETGSTHAAAVELFLERARAACPDLSPDPDELTLIERVTDQLDGLPLAIEMAATRVATMPIAELARRLDDELDVLVSRRRTVAPRHRTLAAVVAWSERLLDEDERALFADMAVFDGAVRADDVAAVTARRDALEVLSRLAERSLLVVDTSGHHARFGMLRTIRDQARQRLAGSGRLAGLTRRHAEHVTAMVAEADRRLRTPDEPEAQTRIEELLGEARAAQAWAGTQDAALAQRLCGALYLFGQSRRRDEVLSWSTTMVERGQVDPPRDGSAAALVLTAAAQRAVSRGELAAALDLAQQATAVGADGALAFAYELVSDVYLYRGRLDRAAAAARAGVDIARQAGDRYGEVVNLINLALSAAYSRDPAHAEGVLAEAPHPASLSPSARAWLLYGEGEVVLDRDPGRALAALDAAATLADTVDNRYISGVARVSATSLRARAGDPEAALHAFGAVIDQWRGQGNQPYQLTTLRNLVVLLQRLGAAPQVAELVATVQDSSVSPTYGDEADRLDDAREWATGQLGPARTAEHLARGAVRTLDQAAVAAMEWIAAMRS